MGIFKKSKSTNFDYLLPDGSKPKTGSREIVAAGIKSLTIDSEKKMSMNPIDSKAWVTASTQLETSGFRLSHEQDLTPMASSKVLIRGLDEDRDEVTALAVLTTEFLTLHWSVKGKDKGMKLFHSDLLGVDVTSPISSFLRYGASLRKSDGDFLNMGEITFEITLMPGKDGHENRRALTFWMSLAYRLSLIIPGIMFMELA